MVNKADQQEGGWQSAQLRLTGSQMRRQMLLCFGVAMAFLANGAHAEDADNKMGAVIKGRFQIRKSDRKGITPVIRERLAISQSGGLPDVVIYIQSNRGFVGGGARESEWMRELQDKAQITVVNGSFSERFVAAPVGGKLTVNNPGVLTEYVRYASTYTIPPKSEVQLPIKESFAVPTAISSDDSDSIVYLLSTRNPYVTVSRNDGSFEIRGIPPGTHILRMWHRDAPLAIHPLYKAGYMEVNVKQGATIDLETIDVHLSNFEFH